MSELSKWCTDLRAFDISTAHSLHTCLHAVRRHAETSSSKDAALCHSCMEGVYHRVGVLGIHSQFLFEACC
jgi:hypothetical protein